MMLAGMIEIQQSCNKSCIDCIVNCLESESLCTGQGGLINGASDGCEAMGDTS